MEPSPQDLNPAAPIPPPRSSFGLLVFGIGYCLGYVVWFFKGGFTEGNPQQKPEPMPTLNPALSESEQKAALEAEIVVLEWKLQRKKNRATEWDIWF
jgi:hypothetical protein